MGVLNVNDHLKHRRRLYEENTSDYTWEGDVDEVPLVEQTPVLTANGASPRQRKPKTKPQYYYETTDHKPKGNRSGRRYENTCFLLSLVDHEEIGELDVTDFVHTTMSIFASLFANPDKMEIWNEFANLPEDEQMHYLDMTTAGAHRDTTVDMCVMADDRLPADTNVFATAEENFLRIEKRIRCALHKRRFPIGGLREMEEYVLGCFSEYPDAVMVSILPSSLDRLLLHAVCQYLNLISNSQNYCGSRLMEIESRSNSFNMPSLALSQYLERKSHS